MEVLNVTEAYVSWFAIVFGVIVAIIAVIQIVVGVLALFEREPIGIVLLLMGGILAAMSYFTLTTPDIPKKYEVVITDPDYVIDATKYEILEQRGEIYVLTDREN